MKHVLIAFVILLMFACVQPNGQNNNNASVTETPAVHHQKKVKNIIFMIGDGMGLTQISAGMIANGNKLNLDQLHHIGLIKTSSKSDLITDSAAGATAFSTGRKTYNKAIGVGPDTVAHETILETARKNGLSTGLIVTSSITHATPACFYAHQPSRYMDEAIAMDMAKHPVDIFVGGGLNFFNQRKDSLNLIDSLTAKGYTILYDVNQIAKNGSSKLGVFVAKEQPPSLLEGRDKVLTKSLPTVLGQLSENPRGFFLMVEGSQIDWGGHANDSDYIIEEMLDFDDAIGQVLDFAAKDSETLVVITADHETGGYAIIGGTLDGKIEAGFSTDYHTATMVPVFAFGPGAEDFTGIYENTGIYHKMMKLFNFVAPS